jgi:cytochrome oxidase assembly protein ShyY1
MYRKKLTYSCFTLPLAVVSFNFYDWQRRRMTEKLAQVDTRSDRIVEDPVDIQNFYNSNQEIKFPWIGLNSKELNEKYAWKVIELNGQFDHSNEVLVAKNREGEEGFDVVTPFYCYRDENNDIQPVLVNRGWIPDDKKGKYEHWIHSTGPISIKGLIYKGDESHKYSKPNDFAGGKFYTLKPEEISVFMKLDNSDVTSKFVVKQLEFNPINRSLYPRVLNVKDLGSFAIPADTNQKYSRLWQSLTFLNIFSNMILWIYL